MSVLRGISGRLLILTVLVVMLVEVAIFVPSVSRFRVEFLEERISRSQIAALTMMAAPDGVVMNELEQKLLTNSETLNIVVHENGSRALALSGPLITGQVRTFDLRDVSAWTLIVDALSHLADLGTGDIIRVIAEPDHGGFDLLEITLPSAPLRAEMLDYGERILQLSLIISLITATMVFFVVRRFVVAPLLRVIRNVKRFQEDPEDPTRVIKPRSAIGEVADAERALSEMQQDVLNALRQRARLASLGEALAKISHDLRNMLASGQLIVDRLEMSEDPTVSRVLPKLVGSMDRAIALCQRTLDFGRSEEQEPDIRPAPLAALVDDVADGLGLESRKTSVAVRNAVDPCLMVQADPDQLYRVLANLIRNAIEALDGRGQEGVVTVVAQCTDGQVEIDVFDNGPGMPARALENLFQPFKGGIRQGGTGLGLAIAQELVRAHGGELQLVASDAEGTRFRISLPDPARESASGEPIETD